MRMKSVIITAIAVCSSVLGAPAAAQEVNLPVYYTLGWDESAGLWSRPGAGHTKGMQDFWEVHEARIAAGKLVAAGLDGLLDKVPTGKVLAALQTMQAIEGPQRGCFRWYLEEKEIRDTNAAFFVGLPLAVLRLQWGPKLAEADRARLDQMLAHLRVWFEAQAADASPRYPNKHLGDLVCGWLLAEAAGEAPEKLARQMRDAATYWREQGWGWGEHMSDTYSHVCLDELAMLLLISSKLPPDVRTDFEGLRDRLLAIEDAYAPGPRVPAIRSYAFTHPPEHTAYRDAIRPWRNDGPTADQAFQPLRGLADALKWHDTAPPAGAPARDVDVPCFGGARARAVIDGPLRIGAMSRYPIMEGIDQKTWGLSWQSFPVAGWHEAGDWCFLQWVTTEGGVTRMHPAEDEASAYLENALSSRLDPPPVGVTHSLRHRSSFIVLRRMPRSSPDWPEVTDRFRLVGGKLQEYKVASEGAWHQLRVTHPGARDETRPLVVSYLSLEGDRKPELQPNRLKGIDWSVHYPLQGGPPRPVVGVWVWSLDTTLAGAPRVQVIEGGWRLAWSDGVKTFAVRVLPEAERPLVDDAAPRDDHMYSRTIEAEKGP
jgi:hypothetical protein